ncbi:hypothetical protein [Methanomassiliicoccus luminyensis]|uniref:hypothetical protein n=1 Tax=Methanomassiliicoccus luminyensis TaxID=1080712 RepID=UPI0012DD3747|nr:hypothetical protein [Methanomassiliicoccus luminyensis]
MKCADHPNAKLSYGPDRETGQMCYTCSVCGRRLDRPQRTGQQGTLAGWGDAPAGRKQ